MKTYINFLRMFGFVNSDNHGGLADNSSMVLVHSVFVICFWSLKPKIEFEVKTVFNLWLRNYTLEYGNKVWILDFQPGQTFNQGFGFGVKTLIWCRV